MQALGRRFLDYWRSIRLIVNSFLTKSAPVIQSDWFLALLLLGIHLAARGYIYGWDDQHLELPLLKKLIDPELYPGDYYVESLKDRFVCFLYPILAKLITIDQIPSTYFSLYLVSRYFLFFFMYKLWKFISRKKSVAFFCVFFFLLSGRVPEFLYRTFSHQEFTLPIVLAGIYLFYRNRFYFSAALFGVAANFHLFYTVFPMTYLGIYLLTSVKRYSWKPLIKTSLIFIFLSLPVAIWILQSKVIHSVVPLAETVDLRHIYNIVCPDTIIFQHIRFGHLFVDCVKWLEQWNLYLLCLALYLFNLFFNVDFRKDKKAQVICLTAFGFLFITYVFTYFIPIGFVLNLNLIRNRQYLFLILFGYTLIFLWKQIATRDLRTAYPCALTIPLLIMHNNIASLSLVSLSLWIFCIVLDKRKKTSASRAVQILSLILIIFNLAVIVSIFIQDYQPAIEAGAVLLLILPSLLIFLFSFKKIKKPIGFLLRFIAIAPAIGFFIFYVIFHITHLATEKYGGGFWKLQRDWINMQHYVRDNTPKNAYLLVPYNMEMGGFRIFSERKIILSYRDSGIIGFDHDAVVEWQKRLDDVEPFKTYTRGDITEAVRKAVFKYGVDYIVFMKYYSPRKDSSPLYTKVYENDLFSLVKVNENVARVIRALNPPGM